VSDTGAPHPQMTVSAGRLAAARRSENQDNFLFFRRGLSFLLFFVSPAIARPSRSYRSGHDPAVGVRA